MKKLMKLVLALGVMGTFAAQAVETQCGTFYWSTVEPLKVPVIGFKTIVLDNGETYVVKAPFVAVNEEATDAISALNDGDEVCYKANSVFISGTRTFYVFSVTKK